MMTSQMHILQICKKVRRTDGQNLLKDASRIKNRNSPHPIEGHLLIQRD